MLNPQQQTAKDFCLSGTGSLNLIARAGTGKTTTLVDIAATLPGRVFLGAFNRSIADELARRIPKRSGLEASTMHSAGLRAWRTVYPNIKVDGQKMEGITRRTLIEYGKAMILDRKLIAATKQLISYAKLSALGLNAPYEDVDQWTRLIEYYDMETEIPDLLPRGRFLESCIKAYEKSLHICCDVVDFDDMLLAPLYFHVRLPQYDWFLSDESQDLNETRMQLMLGMAHSGRICAAGDPQQSIFNFAGATPDAMRVLQKTTHASELPLSVSYRCPKSVVALAQRWVPEFTAHKDNIDGIVRTIWHRDFWQEKFNPETDVITCRYTRPLAGIAVQLRGKGYKCIVEGQSAKGLLGLIEKLGPDLTIGGFLRKLEQYEDATATAWVMEERADKAAMVRDRCGTLRAFARHMKQSCMVRDLKREIEMTFQDRDQSKSEYLTLAVCHRVKGREWDRVFLIGRNEYMPTPYAKTPDALQAEENLQYVAVTRAKKELVEVDVPPKPKKGGVADCEWWELDSL